MESQSSFDYFKTALTQNYANFNGRARRSEYWYFMLFRALFMLGIMSLGILVGKALSFYIPMAMFALFYLATLVPSIAVMVRRLHDTDKSAWWLLLNLIPGGGLVLIIFCCIEGTYGPNSYGPDPKYIEANLTDELVY